MEQLLEGFDRSRCNIFRIVIFLVLMHCGKQSHFSLDTYSVINNMALLQILSVACSVLICPVYTRSRPGLNQLQLVLVSLDYMSLCQC